MNLSKRILIALMVFLLLPVTVFAAGSVDLDEQTSLRIHVRHEDTPLTGMEFHAYQVAAMDAVGELTVTTPFAAYAEALDIRGESDSAWWEMATKLEREIILNPTISPTATAKVDNAGELSFINLPKGLYLIFSDGMELDEYIYTTSAFFIMLPTQDQTSNSWNYQVVASAKPARSPALADFEVVKIWKDDCHKAERPKSVTIVLMCGEKVYDTVTLPQDGHWSYTWKDLDVNHKWTVAEVQQEGYGKPEITREGNTFTVTNTCNKPSAPVSPNLPQTGQLWWPVPMLVVAGLLCIIIGLLRCRRAEDEA